MKRQIVLLLWTLTAFFRCDGASEDPEITVTSVSDGIKLGCKDDSQRVLHHQSEAVEGTVLYQDENTGEYECVATDSSANGARIFVKFRTCDNCVKLDQISIAGLVIGDVIATIVIGVAVYLIVSQAGPGPGPITSHKKSSDRQHLVPNEVNKRAPNDHYQPLKSRGGQKDTYDVLHNRK